MLVFATVGVLLVGGSVCDCVSAFGFAPTPSIDKQAPRAASLVSHRVVFKHDNVGALTTLYVGTELDIDEGTQSIPDDKDSSPLPPSASSPMTTLSTLWAALTGSGPPLDVDDPQLLLYDVFLLVNLSVSISVYVVHRLNFYYLAPGLHEGALLSLCWIVAGLGNGIFLHSAVDGHYSPSDADYAEKGGPRAAGLLAVSTFVTTASLRIVVALALAVPQGRPVGTGLGEDIIPLEILFGLVVMSAWRFAHSLYTPRF